MIKDLERIGLTPGESKVYVALLKLGPSKVGKVVKESGVSYSKVYDVLERLTAKGLASETIVSKVKQYRAVEPYQLTEFIKKKEEDIQDQKNRLNAIMKDLLTLSKEKGRSKAEVFLGMDGMKTVHTMLLEEKEKVLRFFFPPHSEKASTFYKRFYPKFEDKGFEIRGIGNIEKKPKGLPKHVKIKKVDFPVPGTIDVIGDKVLILSWTDNPTAVLIHSEEISQHFREYFDSVWKVAK